MTDSLTLSKTAGTYQSTPGLYNIQLNDVIIGAKSGVVAAVSSSAVYQDPVTGEFIGQVDISPGSSFFGLLFNRITSTSYPNVVIDDISKSQISIVDFTDNSTAYNTNFPSNEIVSNYVIPYGNAVGSLQIGEDIRNYKIEYGNNSGDFTAGEGGRVRKISMYDKEGEGFFNAGQIIRTRDTKAEVIGYNQARGIVYLGKIGRSKSNGEDYFDFVFTGDAQISSVQKKWGDTSLKLDGSGDYIGVASTNEIAFGTGDFTIECWIRPDTAALAGLAEVYDTRTSDPEISGRIYLNGAQIRYNVNGSDLVTSGSTVIPTNNTWYHIAVSRSGTTIKMFLDGVQVGASTDSSTYVARPIRIGSTYQATNSFTGYIDDFRISDVARYTAAFTPPAGIFQGDNDTKLLLHFDSENDDRFVDDWSGGESFTNTEYFNNDPIVASKRYIGNHTYVGGTVSNAVIFQQGIIPKDVTDATYNGLTGDLVLTIGSHSYTTSNTIKIAPNSLTFTCDMDSNATQHTYPRITDPVYDTAIAITSVSATTITVNVGVAIQQGFAKNSHRYNNAGQLILKNLEFIAKEVVYMINQKFPNFTVIGGDVNCEDDVKDICRSIVADMRNGGNNKTWLAVSYYIDRTDTANVKLLNIETEVRETIWAYNKLDQMLEFIVTNSEWKPVGDHGLKQYTDTSITDSSTSSFTYKTPTGATYDAGTGDLTLTIDGHNLYGRRAVTVQAGTSYNAETGILSVTSASHLFQNGDKVMLEKESLTFTCDMDGHKTEHKYPRASDPALAGWLTVSNSQTNTFDLDVGKSPLLVFNPTGGSYDASTGHMKLQIGDNILTPGTNIKVAPNSIYFRCTSDGLQAVKKYPRTTDPIAGKPTPIAYDGEQLSASFANYTPTTGVMKITAGKTFTPLDATYNAVNGMMNLTIPDHGMQAGDTVRLEDGAITFTCAMDDHYSTHAYPRTTDPKRGLQLSITNVQTHSFSVNVGISPKVQLTPNNGSYDPSTGLMTLEFNTAHGLTAGTSIKIAKESLTFSCGFGGASGDAAKKSYPRSTDPFYDTAVKIESATTNAITVKILENVPSTNTDTHTWVGATTGCIHTGGDYEHIFHSALTNGVVWNKHGLVNGDRIKIATNSLTFTCNLDDQETEHSYPRSTDPYNGRWLAVSNVGANTFDVNVGISPDTSSHTFKSAYTNGLTKRDGSITLDVGKSPRVGYDVAGATYDPLTGDMVLNVGIHNLLENQTIQIADNGLSFTCSMDGNATTHSYPRLTDPSRKHALNITDVGETSKTIAGAGYTPSSILWVECFR